MPSGHPAQARHRLGPQQSRQRPEAQGKLDEAVAAYRAAIRIKPDSAFALYYLGLVFTDRSKREEAIAEFRKARDLAQRGSELAQLIEAHWPGPTGRPAGGAAGDAGDV